MAKWNFFVLNTSLIKELDTSGNDVNPQSQSFLAPTLDLQGSKIVFKDNGSYKTALLFTEIGEIDGVNPSDLQDAYDRIIALIPNNGGGGGSTPDATTTVKGKLKLAGDLSGTADLPTVPELANKQAILTSTNFGAFSNSLTDKTTPVDADTVNLVDSADSNNAKKVSLTNFKLFLKTYFDTQYQPRQSFKLTDTVPSSDLTGTTTETVMKSYTIDANSFAIGDFFNVKLHINYTTANAGSTRIQYLKVSNTNNYATANTVLQNNNSASSNYALLRNSLYFVSGNILRTVTSETSRTIDNGNFNGQPVDYSLDPTQPIYVWVGMKNPNTTDVSKFLSLSITN